jgi:hypothetical protein
MSLGKKKKVYVFVNWIGKKECGFLFCTNHGVFYLSRVAGSKELRDLKN